MRIPDDLSIDDMVVRDRLATTLRLSREARGISYRQVAELLGVTTPAVYTLERRTTWEAKTVMRYARAVGFRIEWHIHDLVVPDDGDVMSVIIAAGDTSTPQRQDRVHWRAVCYDLVRIRRAAMPAATFAAQLGVTENAVSHWEANPDGSTVISAQRHARALGGSLSWWLHEVASPLTDRAPAQRKAS